MSTAQTDIPDWIQEDATVSSFEQFGTLVPAGTVEDHLMDARIFRLIQNRLTQLNWLDLIDQVEELRCTVDRALNAAAIIMRVHNWERTILVPKGNFECCLAVAARQEGPTKLFRLTAGVAANIKAGVLFSPLLTENCCKNYWLVGDPAGLTALSCRARTSDWSNSVSIDCIATSRESNDTV